MEYVSEVLGKQGWERAESLETYFAGCGAVTDTDADVPDDVSTIPDTDLTPKSSNKACQTPAEWCDFKPAQQPKNAQRNRAEPRNRALQPDEAPEKKPKPEPIFLAEAGPADAGMKEVLFWSLLLCVTHRGRIKELDSYVKAVLLEEPNISDSWTPSADRWTKDTTLQVSSIHTPLEYAHRCVVWTEGALDAVGLAMQGWRGEGFVNGLSGNTLKRYISKPLPGPRTDKKSSVAKIPPRYRSKAVVRVARLLHDHGAKLRRLLNITAESDDAKPMHVVLAELEQQNVELKGKLSEEAASAKRLQDAWRKAAGRLKEKNHAVTEARRDERAKLKDERKALKAKARDEARMEVKADLDRMNRLRNDANARARTAETDQRKAKRKVARLEKASKEDADMADAEDSDAKMADEDPTRRLPFEVLPRRSETGQFQAESMSIRSLRWAQEARGVDPSTVSQNLEDAFALLAPGIEIPAMCDRQNRMLRGEVTIAGEGMAAWKFAKSKRVKFAGWDESTKFGDAVFACTFVIENWDGTVEEICLRGLSLIPDGTTSEAILKHIEERHFEHARNRLASWRDWTEKTYGKGTWAEWGGPSPDNIGLAP